MNEKTKSLVMIILLAILLMCIISVLIWDLVMRIKRGWNANDTIQIIFSITIAITGLVSSSAFLQYFIYKDKRFLVLNNKIYKAFSLLEERKMIDAFEAEMINTQNTKLYKQINNIFQKKYPDVCITKENIKDFFNLKYCVYFNDDYPCWFIDTLRMESKVKKIVCNRSYEYEELFRNIHSGDILKKNKFPLLEVVLPFVLGAMGFFETFYQALSVSESINEPLKTFLFCFLSAIFFSFSLGFAYSTSMKESVIYKNEKTLQLIKEFCNKNKISS